MKWFIHFGVLLAAAAGISVSRIGGGSVNSLSSGFEMQLPHDFQNIDQVENMVLARGPLTLSHLGPVQQTLQIREYQDHFSRLKDSSRIGTIRHFVERGWSQRPALNHRCLEVFTFKNETATSYVATWGAGRGVTISGPYTQTVEYAIYQSLEALKIQPGFCGWSD